MTDPDQSTPRTRLSDGPRQAAADGKACVIVIFGEGIGRRADIGPLSTVVGRGEDADLRIDNISVSRQHCQIWRDTDVFRIRDLGATNPTQLNERVIKEAILLDGDHITVGECILKFISNTSPEAQYHEEIHQLAVQDPLTGLSNRRHFIDVVEHAIARAARHAQPLAFCIIDIDHFKSINDVHGHLEGDRVLRDVADTLRSLLRANDILGRIGGEEFGLLLPETGPEAALEIAERLRVAVQQAACEAGSSALGVTISIGMATLGGDMQTRSSLMASADAALYRAKAAGRNRVCADDYLA
ncbi:MAG: GGDEF domain-containing protein [Pseudomonadota bacterium]|nr:GGDEF domain-containing protein [Pseudomonadota bacterium]